MISFTLKEKDKIQNQQEGRVNGQSSPKKPQSDEVKQSDHNPEKNGYNLRDPKENGIGLGDDSGLFTRGETPFLMLILVFDTEPFEADKFGAEDIFGSPEVNGEHETNNYEETQLLIGDKF